MKQEWVKKHFPATSESNPQAAMHPMKWYKCAKVGEVTHVFFVIQRSRIQSAQHMVTESVFPKTPSFSPLPCFLHHQSKVGWCLPSGWEKCLNTD